MSSRYKCIVFDLDDTLLDTNGRLVPAAAREACHAMIAAGLETDAITCYNERASFIAREPRGNVYKHLVAKFGVRTGANPESVIDAGFRAFHQRDVGPEVALFDGAQSLLEHLERLYTLYLVTSGNEATQKQKVALLGIERCFTRVIYVDPRRGQTKLDAFREIMRMEGGEPGTFLSVGNRVDTDIATAKELGWDTCWVRTGEYAHMMPDHPLETPDYEIPQIRDLGARCRL
ncbi:MAG: HAD family hydrolase [Bdellovibrionaceae bacterium]|nr:HAD family hydrolase [Pseudobdellovibrionaceae bacterium]